MTNPWKLTEREAQILSMLAEHGTAKHVANVLGISPRTVEIHTANAFRAMGLHHRMQAVVAWDRWARAQA